MGYFCIKRSHYFEFLVPLIEIPQRRPIVTSLWDYLNVKIRNLIMFKSFSDFIALFFVLSHKTLFMNV